MPVEPSFFFCTSIRLFSYPGDGLFLSPGFCSMITMYVLLTFISYEVSYDKVFLCLMRYWYVRVSRKQAYIGMPFFGARISPFTRGEGGP